MPLLTPPKAQAPPARSAREVADRRCSYHPVTPGSWSLGAASSPRPLLSGFGTEVPRRPTGRAPRGGCSALQEGFLDSLFHFTLTSICWEKMN